MRARSGASLASLALPEPPFLARRAASAGLLPVVAACIAALGLAGLIAACAAPASPTPPPVLSIEWEAIDPDPTGSGGPTAFATLDGVIVGVGEHLAWLTEDGRSWTPVPLPGAGDGDHAEDIVATADALVAVGSVANAPAAWRTTDGRAWERIEDDDLAAAPGRHGRIAAVATSGTRIVAVGVEFGAVQRPVAWWSPDGIDWSRAETQLDGNHASDVVAVPDGFLLVGAGRAGPGEMTTGGLWFSDDGRTWARVGAGEPGFRNAGPARAVAFDGRLIMVGSRMPGLLLSGAVWTSTDGRAWVPIETPAFAWWPFAGPTPATDRNAIQGTQILDVAQVGSSLLAVGVHWGVPPDSAPDGPSALVIRSGMWRSTDGTDWELVPNDLIDLRMSGDAAAYVSAALTGIDVIAGRPVIVGRTPTGTMLWLGSSAGE
jgi:hypothetical protein